MEFTVGYDALAVYVHKDNPLGEITLEQLREVYVEGGKISRWSQTRRADPRVSATTRSSCVSRQSSSGTYEFFREHVLGKRDFRLGSRDLSGSKEVVELVGLDADGDRLQRHGLCDPRGEDGQPGQRSPASRAVEASVANVTSKAYPLARSLHLYTLGEPQGEIKKYIDWILSDAGQKIVADSGYVPVAPESADRTLTAPTTGATIAAPARGERLGSDEQRDHP